MMRSANSRHHYGAVVDTKRTFGRQGRHRTYEVEPVSEGSTPFGTSIGYLHLSPLLCPACLPDEIVFNSLSKKTTWFPTCREVCLGHPARCYPVIIRIAVLNVIRIDGSSFYYYCATQRQSMKYNSFCPLKL